MGSVSLVCVLLPLSLCLLVLLPPIPLSPCPLSLHCVLSPCHGLTRRGWEGAQGSWLPSSGRTPAVSLWSRLVFRPLCHVSINSFATTEHLCPTKAFRRRHWRPPSSHSCPSFNQQRAQLAPPIPCPHGFPVTAWAGPAPPCCPCCGCSGAMGDVRAPLGHTASVASV